MEDKRKNNGGNSTKAKSPHDKRLNRSKGLLDKYIKDDLDYDKLKKLLDSLYKGGMGGDTKSSSLFLAYVLGKPKETRDITSGGETINNIISLGSGKE